MLDDLRHLLFDFPDQDRERQELEAVLREAIAEAKETQDFEKALRRVLHQRDPEEAEARWRGITFLLNDYRKVEDLDSDQWVVAERLLADLPRRYGQGDA